MLLKATSKEIIKISDILVNNFYNIKDVEKLKNYIFRQLSNFYIFTLQNNLLCYIEYDSNVNSYSNFLNLLKSDFNSLFSENIQIKEENIKILIIGGEDDE